MATKLRDVTTGDGNIIGVIKQARITDYDDMEILWYEDNGGNKIIHKMILDCHLWKLEVLKNGLVSISTNTQPTTGNNQHAITLLFKR